MFVHMLTPRVGPPIELGRVTVVVGANHSGKSTLLQDVFRLATGRDPGAEQEQTQIAEPVLLQDMQYGGSLQDEELLLSSPGRSTGSQATVLEGLGGDLRRICRAAVRPESWNIVKPPVLHARSVLESELPDLMQLRTAYLGCETLDSASLSAAAASPLEPPRHLLQLLQRADDETRAELDAAFAAAFPPLGLRLDDSQHVRLSLRVAQQYPEPLSDPRAHAQQWSELELLDDAGRGCRHFASLALAVLLLPARIIMADEPDASLQPLAARQLGRWLGQMVAERESQLIVNARTPSLAAGILERCQDAVIVRLQRRDSQVKLGAVPAEVSREVAKSPMVALDQAMAALQGQGVILTETHGEAAALSALSAQRGGADRWSVMCVHGARYAAPLVRMFRDANLPAAVIAALSVLRHKTDFAKLLEAACRGTPPRGWLATRDQLARHMSTMVDQKAMAAHTRAMEQMLERYNQGDQHALDQEVPDDEASDPWTKIEREGTAGISVDQRPWVEQMIEELKSAGVFLKPFEASMIAAGLGGRGARAEELEKLLKAIRAGQCPDRLAVLLTEVLHWLRQPTAPAPPDAAHHSTTSPR